MRFNVASLAALFLLLLGGCSGSAGRVNNAISPQLPESGHQALPGKHVNASLALTLGGSEVFEPGPGVTLNLPLDRAKLEATSIPSWAMYRFDEFQYFDKAITVDIEFAGTSTPEYWLGIADYATDAWYWVPGHAGLVAIGTNVQPISFSGAIYVVVLVENGTADIMGLTMTVDTDRPFPIGLNASDGTYGNKIQLSWEDPGFSYDPDGPDAEIFEYEAVVIERRFDPEDAWLELATVPSGTYGYEDIHQQPGNVLPAGEAVEYRLRLQADGVGGHPSPSETGFRTSVAPTENWVRTIGGLGFDNAVDAALDSSGHCYVLGSWNEFAEKQTVALAKYSADGTFQWLRQYDSEHSAQPGGVCVSPAGEVYLGITELQDDDSSVLLVALDGQGTLLWSRKWLAPKAMASRMAINNSGQINMAVRTEPAEHPATALLRFSADGELLVQQVWSSQNDNIPLGLAINGAGDTYVTGVEESSIGSERGMILKFSAAGPMEWNRIVLGQQAIIANNPATDSSGVYVPLETQDHGEQTEWLLISLDQSGEFRWARSWGGGAVDQPLGFSLGDAGNLYCAGTTFSFGAGASDIAMLTLDNDGDLLAEQIWQGTGERAALVRTDLNGVPHLIGRAPSNQGNWETVIGDGGKLMESQLQIGGTSELGIELAHETQKNVAAFSILAGVADTGGGDTDLLVMKYDPNQ